MVRQAKSGEGNPSAEFILEKQFKQFKISKPQIRRGKSRKENLEVNLESLYSQLEPLPSTGTDLFVRDEEGYIDTLLDNKGLREFKRGIQFIIPPPQENEGGGK